MTQNYLNEINNAKRDALVSYYLVKNIANNPAVRTRDDLFDHLVLDVQVDNAVVTSEIGEAIASSQTYINRVLKGLEPDVQATPDEARVWQERRNRYAVWAGYQQLKAYPENYLNPTMRLKKTSLFEALETRLNQGRINDDAVQAAVLDYLNQFEEVSNLEVVSGYQDGLLVSGNTLYFIGRNKKSPYQYYWRSLQMPKSSEEAVHPSAWTEWKKIEGLAGANEGMVQPVFMNSRLYVVWCEVVPHAIPDVPKESKESAHVEYRISMKLAFKRFDDTWSAPRELYTVTETEEPHRFVAVKDISTSNDAHLYLALYDSSQKIQFDKAYDALLNESDKNTAYEGLYGDSDPAVIRKPYSLNESVEYESESHIPYHMPSLYVRSLTVNKGVFILRPGIKDAESKDGKQEIEYVVCYDQTEVYKEKISLGELSKLDVSIDMVFNPGGRNIISHSLNFLSGVYGVAISSQTIKLSYVPTANSWLTLETKGKAQYLTVKEEGGGTIPSLPIRLNTLFAKELIRRASNGIDGVMASASSADENGDPDGASIPLDFNGANSLYLWELFFHMPFLVAHRLNQEQHYTEATRWLHYLFDPSRLKAPWKVHPLADTSKKATYISDDITDPDARAMAEPRLYQKAVFFAYLKNLIAQGDACFRELSRDGLADAKQWYRQAQLLLGQQPDEHLAPRWTVQTAGEAFKQDAEIRSKQEQQHHSHTGIFALPRNTTLQQYWTQLDSRLYNLRHGLNLAGQPLSLPLFAIPRNPTELLAARRAGGGQGAGGEVGALKVPPYRFAVMINKAYGAVETLMQFGSALQGALERKDNAHLELMQQNQQHELLAQFTIGLQLQSIALSKANQAALKISQDAATGRHEHYQDLLENDDISKAEVTALALRSTAIAASLASSAFRPVGALADMVPTIFGMAVGGQKYGQIFYAASAVAGEAANAMTQSAYVIETSEQYRRRLQEWTLMRDQAVYDVTQITEQIKVEVQQQAIQEQQLAQLKAQQTQVKDTLDFLSTRFSGESLYQWMVGQLSSLYFQAYDGVMGLCLATEAAWQFETGVFDGPRFIQPGAWSDRYHGLLAGEALKLGLQRLDQAYLLRNERKLEIVHTVSLKALGFFKKEDAGWKDMFLKTGKLDFSFTEKDFAERYPGHYLRQIAAVTVTLPALTGPYQDVRAILSQTKNSFSTQPGIEAFRQLLDGTGTAPQVQRSLRANQKVALSTGIEDGGSFQLNFVEERYLAFEGTGVVSSWELSFPNPGNAEQAKMLESLTDVIVRIRYTALDGGKQFADQVSAFDSTQHS